MKDFKENIFAKTDNKSIFDYITDKSKFINDNKCNNFTPPFLSYIPTGVPNKNIDIDSSIKGMDQYLTKCTEFKYNYPKDSQKLFVNEKIEKECNNEFNILPSGYMPFNKFMNNERNDKS